MRDLLNDIFDRAWGPFKNLFDHDRYKTLGYALAFLWVGIAGCEILHPSRTDMVMGPTSKPVTRQELNQMIEIAAAELEAEEEELIAEFEARKRALTRKAEKQNITFKHGMGDLDMKDERRTLIFKSMTDTIAAVPGPLQAILATVIPALSFITMGASGDNMRKASILANRPKTEERVRTGES